MSDTQPRPPVSPRSYAISNAILAWARHQDPSDPGYGRELAGLLERQIDHHYKEETGLYQEVEQWLDRNPDAVRVREGGGPECLAMSFAVTIAKAGLTHFPPKETQHACIACGGQTFVPHHGNDRVVCARCGTYRDVDGVVNTPNIEQKSRCWHLLGNSPTNLNQVCIHQGKWHQVDNTGWTEISRERAAELINGGFKDDTLIRSTIPNRVHRIEPHLVTGQINNKIRELERQKEERMHNAETNVRNYNIDPSCWGRHPDTPEQVGATYDQFIEHERTHYSTVRVIERPDGDKRFILVYGDEDDNFVIHGTGPFSNFETAQEWFCSGGR